MALGEVYEVVVHEVLDGITVNNVFHLRDYSGSGDYQDAADDFAANAVPALRNCVSGQVLFQSVATRMIYPFTNFGGGHGVNLNGTLPGVSVPPLVCAVVTWLTGSVGKRYRGRTYFSGLQVANLSGAFWDAASQNILATNMATILNRYGPFGTSPSYKLGVWSRANGVTSPTTTVPAGFTACTGFTVRGYVCAMGTRRSGHGT